ncbi:MAG: TolC family protein [Salinivirgaceae bacterium]|nr:TolC family protein [Salinivirgaceae bacterium]
MRKLQLIIAIGFLSTTLLWAQEPNKFLNLEQVLELAKSQSPDAILAKHRYLRSYWEYKSYKAGLLPQLSFQSDLVDWNKSIITYTNSDGSVEYKRTNNVSSQIGLGIFQNIGLTGGSVYVQSEANGLHDFRKDSLSRSYNTSPIAIGFTQPLFQYNSFKWQRKIEPLKFQEARREYMQQLEEISSEAVNYFYNLALAQLNVEISKANFYNNDTIYKIAKGRYNIGTIAENDVLQIELAYLNAKSALAQAKINLEISRYQLRSFLGFNELVTIQLMIPTSLPFFEIDVHQALTKAKENNSTALNWERQLFEAQSEVAQTKAVKRFNANLSASYGLNGEAYIFNDSYKNPDDQLALKVGIEVPILDWGQGKGKYRMALSQQEVVKTQVEQARIDFEQQILLKVMQFNEQDEQVLIAAKADTIARKRYEVTKQRFLIGKIDVLDLNVASQENDLAQRNYLEAQKTYWSYFYAIRQYTLFDFIKRVPLETDYKELED